jgi:dipeptidyl aminopeptidase/acylaminoacyl peptidase
MANGDPQTKTSAERNAKVVEYFQAIAGAAMLLFAIVDRFRPSSLPLSVAVTAAFAGFAAIAALRSRRRREHVPPLTIAAGIVGGIFVAASWIGLSTPESGNEPVDEQSDARPTPVTQTPGEDPVVESSGDLLCASPEPAADSWFLFETAGAERMITIEPDGEQPWSLPGAAFAAAGTRVVYADVADARRVEIMDLTVREVVASTALNGRVMETTISRDGDQVVVVEDRSGDTRLVQWRPSSDDVTVLHDPLIDVSAPALSPSGDQLAWVEGPNRSGRLVLADVATLGERVITEDGADPAWSPDGSVLVYSAPFGEGRAIYAETVDIGENWRVTNPVQADDYYPAVLPTCDGVVYARAAGGTVDLWETRDSGAEEMLRELAGAQSRPAFANN